MFNKPRLLDQFREEIRKRHFGYRTDNGRPGERSLFLSSATERNVTRANQAHALAAIYFLYEDVLEIELLRVGEVIRAKPSMPHPVVLIHAEVAPGLDGCTLVLNQRPGPMPSPLDAHGPPRCLRS